MSDFKSKLSSYIDGLIEEQHAMGFSFKGQTQELRRFDKFLIDNNLDTGRLDSDVISLWEVRLPTEQGQSQKR